MEKSELERALLAQAPVQQQRFQKKKRKLSRTKSKDQREVDDVKKLIEKTKRKYMTTPHLREINLKMNERNNPVNASELMCPKCRDPDRGNKMNRKPWCFKCNLPLTPKGKGQPRIRVVKGLKDELRRLNPGLNPKN